MNGEKRDAMQRSDRGWLLVGPEGWCYRVSESVGAWLGCPTVDCLGRGWTRKIDPGSHESTRQAIAAVQGGDLFVRWRPVLRARSGECVTVDIVVFRWQTPILGGTRRMIFRAERITEGRRAG